MSLTKKIFFALIIIISLFLLFQLQQIFQYNSEHEILNNKETVYKMATEFLRDVYDLNIDEAYTQLENRSEAFQEYNGYISKEEWGELIELDFTYQTLNKILKPLNSSETSYILHSDEPKETYLVEFCLDVNHVSTREKRTGELEYIKTDDGFRIHSFEIDISPDPEEGRWVLY
jgi:hypothetical protein